MVWLFVTLDQDQSLTSVLTSLFKKLKVAGFNALGLTVDGPNSDAQTKLFKLKYGEKGYCITFSNFFFAFLNC